MIRPHNCPHCQCPLVEEQRRQEPAPGRYYDVLEQRRREAQAELEAELAADRARRDA